MHNKVTHLNHPQTIIPTHVHGKIVLHENGSRCQNGWGPLPKRTLYWTCSSCHTQNRLKKASVETWREKLGGDSNNPNERCWQPGLGWFG